VHGECRRRKAKSRSYVILAWNPILHAVDWFRSSFYQEYDPHWLDRSYLSTVAVLTLLAGLGLERGLRRRLYEPL